MLELRSDHQRIPAANPQRNDSWVASVVLLLILALGLGLRLQHLGSVTSWFDESFGWRMVQFSPSEIAVRSGLDVHPPMYFWVLKGWGQLFGNSLVSLRCCAVVFGELTILGAYILMRRATLTDSQRGGNRWAALLAALFVALSPPHIYWAQQIKMYTFGAALAVWTTWLLISWFQTRARWRLCCYVPLAAALTLQHHYGAFTVCGQLTFALAYAGYHWWTRSDNQLLPVFIASWATTALWSLWIPSLLYQRDQVRHQYWIQGFDWQSIAVVWAQLFLPSEHAQPSAEVAWTVCEIVWVVIAILLVRGELAIRCLGWLALAPYVLAVGWSSVSHNVLVARFLIFSQVFVLMGGAALIGWVPSKWLRGMITVIAVAGLSWTTYARWTQRAAEADVPGMPEVVRLLREIRTSEERVLVCNPMLYLNVLVHGSELPNVFAFDPGGPFPHFQGTPVMKDSDYCSLATLKQSDQKWIWTIDAEQWLGSDWTVQLPSEWKLQHEQRVREWYATLVIRSYKRSLPRSAN